MEYKLIFGIASTVVAIITFIPYLRDIFKHQTKPHAYSWLVWSLLQLVGVAAQLKAGAGFGAWALAIGAVFCFTIFLLSFKYGTKNIKPFDSVCLVGALIALVFYIFLPDPLWSIVLVSVIDFVGFLPTMRKGYQEPSTETSSTFALAGLANLLSLLALQNYNLTTVLYLASLFITNSTMVAILLVRRRPTSIHAGDRPNP